MPVFRILFFVFSVLTYRNSVIFSYQTPNTKYQIQNTKHLMNPLSANSLIFLKKFFKLFHVGDIVNFGRIISGQDFF